MCSIIATEVEVEDPFLDKNSTCNCSDKNFWYVDFCDCDYPNDEPLQRVLEDVLTVGFVYALVFIVGILGNVTVIYAVAHYSRLRTVTNVFLASLSISDLFLLVFCIPIQYVKYISNTWIMGSFLCSSVHYVQMFTMICSVLTLTAISIERYLAIAQPMQSLSLSSIGRAKRTIAIIWIFSMILAIPAWLTNQTETFTTKKNRSATWCSRWYPRPIDTFEKLFVLYQSIVLFAIPVATMTFCYIQVGRILYVAKRQFCGPNDGSFRASTGSDFGRPSDVERQEPLLRKCEPLKHRIIAQSGSRSDVKSIATMSRKSNAAVNEQNLRQVIQMLIAIVVLFIVCWSPYLLDDLLVAFKVYCGQSNTTFLKHMRMIFAIMAYSNSCQNPIVYAFMSKQFKQVFGKYCCKLCYGKHKNSASDLLKTAIVVKQNNNNILKLQAAANFDSRQFYRDHRKPYRPPLKPPHVESIAAASTDFDKN